MTAFLISTAISLKLQSLLFIWKTLIQILDRYI